MTNQYKTAAALTALAGAIGPEIREDIKKQFGPASCYITSAALLRALQMFIYHYSLEVAPVLLTAQRIEAYNRPFMQWIESHERQFPETETEFAEVEEAGGYMLEMIDHKANSRPIFPGHVFVGLRDADSVYLMDWSIDQMSRPAKGIRIPGLLNQGVGDSLPLKEFIFFPLEPAGGEGMLLYAGIGAVDLNQIQMTPDWFDYSRWIPYTTRILKYMIKGAGDPPIPFINSPGLPALMPSGKKRRRRRSKSNGKINN